MITKTKTFDCVKWIREIRDRNNEKNKHLSINDFVSKLTKDAQKSEMWDMLVQKNIIKVNNKE